ncbi:low molecular weight protein tyrosine phosphatase family protein [Cytophaga hutchinsonii]|uniref:Protein-tyrosine-phosphatase n=1 Tax=Cytophaga hutchinsonii (strain ATCC 33406 / DSM 1761 / CIP 103989 / NBRC 15051 / NCIMB 9469 / D465) TaxID=269798 RepID=A0A6N4SPW8_CYTH3|nr:protein-tyrosine-phosphatase [Cytophaga hutchinsonii]ABG58388.1 protein-tyrosine-phosphatase [Cytophaga hutchinsonii ATCC 33406]SFX51164.1 protein-tyrosine phosphatase [Cytophaga hutchinsonii ATCC 33406]
MNILFVCSRNKRRSLTAETIYKNSASYTVRSAGTEPSARIKVTARLIDWAEVVFVMEKKHKQRMFENFQNELSNKEIVVLDIPDDFRYMDEELIEILQTSVDSYFRN